MPSRDQYFFVCTNRRADGHPKGSCAEKGAEAVLAQLKEALALRGIQKVVARACASSCLDLCESGITVLHEPRHVAYGGVTQRDVDDLADAAAQGKTVDRLAILGDEVSVRGGEV
jgi:(2Fe-2S) ferredoxin